MTSASELRYVRPVQPLRFPSSDPGWEMGQSLGHLMLCELLRVILRQAVTEADSVGCDQFVYFDASNPKRKCAPDGFVKLGVAQTIFDTWQTWEHGTPELAVEILSPSDTPEKLTWAQKMDRFHAMGVREIVAFNTDAPRGKRLEAWDRIENDLVERVVTNESTPCLTLGLHWVIRPATSTTDEAIESMLRLARDANGEDLILTPPETDRQQMAALAAAHEAKIAAQGAAHRASIAALTAEVERLRGAAKKKPRKRPRAR